MCIQLVRKPAAVLETSIVGTPLGGFFTGPVSSVVQRHPPTAVKPAPRAYWCAENSGDDLASVERDGDRYGRPSISGKSKELV